MPISATDERYFTGPSAAIKLSSQGFFVGGQFVDAANMDQWSLSVAAERIEQSDYNSPTARFLRGVPVATVMFSGPYQNELGNLNLVIGDELTVDLFFDKATDIGIKLDVIIVDFSVRAEVKGLIRTEWTALVQGNFLTPDVDSVTEEILI